jgi:hypothetical protein
VFEPLKELADAFADHAVIVAAVSHLVNLGRRRNGRIRGDNCFKNVASKRIMLGRAACAGVAGGAAETAEARAIATALTTAARAARFTDAPRTASREGA